MQYLHFGICYFINNTYDQKRGQGFNHIDYFVKRIKKGTSSKPIPFRLFGNYLIVNLLLFQLTQEDPYLILLSAQFLEHHYYSNHDAYKQHLTVVRIYLLCIFCG